jgi:hypothetical protein
MRTILLWLLITVFSTVFSHSAQSAAETAVQTGLDTALETVPFEGVQHECRQVAGIKFGANERWANCHVTRGRWVATIDFLDIYQAQYCLGKTPDSCEQRAQVLFANRAYTLDATVLLGQLDEAGTSYSDPMVVNSGDDSVMSMGSLNAAGVAASRYYVWRGNHWLEMEAQHWQHDLQAALPKGTSSRVSALPDLETMSADVTLFKSSDADCCPSGGVAKVALGLASEVEKVHFIVKQVNIEPK